MAKAKNLAGLAALGALGYMLTKGKSKDDAGDQTSSSYSPSSTATKMADMATNESAYSPQSNMTPLQGAGDATNDPVAKPKKAATSGALAAKKVLPDAETPSRGSSASQLGNLSRSVNREAKTKQFAGEVPEELSAQKTDALAVASRAARAADARRRAATAGGMKKGGAVKKMASGGMTASKRADGIASRGKTKCKMY
jgi:hypothetical protein